MLFTHFFINSKGFGGNNASAAVLAPHITMKMLSQKHDESTLNQYKHRNATVAEKAQEYDNNAINGDFKVHYHFGENVIDENKVNMTQEYFEIPGFGKNISLSIPCPYPDMAL